MKMILSLVLAFSFIFASSEIHFSKGWSLVSLSSSLKNMDNFENENVELIWAFDASQQLWKGYSPQKDITQKIEDESIETLQTLDSFQAFWIFSKESWSMKIEDTLPTTIENETIVLKKGWNLISLPQRVSVSSSFFGDALVWKYNQESGWSVNDASLAFPTIEDIKESDALWVKSEDDREIDMSETLSKLQTFNSEEEMLAYIREMLEQNNYYDNTLYYTKDIATPALANDDSFSASNSESKSVDATSTNLQEAGVDESDIVKNNGKYIFSIDRAKSQIFITSFENIASSNYTPLNTIGTKDKTVFAMYLQENRLILLSNSANEYYILGDAVTSVKESIALYPNGSRESFSVEIYDISNILDIKLLASYTLDGSYKESRVVDKKLFLMSAFYPEIEYDYPKIYDDGVCSQLDSQSIYSTCSNEVISSEMSASLDRSAKYASCENGEDYDAYYANSCYRFTYDKEGVWRYDYDSPSLKSENLLPTIVKDGVSRDLVSPWTLYAPFKLNQTATITTLSSFDIDDAEYKESLSFVGNTENYYASVKSFYLVSSEYPLYYNYENYQEQQMIYKFGIGDTLEYKARGFVEGRMLNQFSMSERDDYLRVATTSGFSWSSDATKNSVFTMKESGDLLEVKVTLSGLGKEGEVIKAVRFMGERGFIVTFKESDPFYTLDMSNPLEPKVMGELSISGFSRYLHIVDENRVLSVGRDADEKGVTEGLILQLFDISDFSNPLLVDKVQIGTASTYSPAEYNHKAFVYRSSDMMFGLPYTEYDYNSYNASKEKFGIYKVDGMKISEIKTLTQENQDSYWYDEKRGLIFDIGEYSYGALIEGSNIISESLNREETE